MTLIKNREVTLSPIKGIYIYICVCICKSIYLYHHHHHLVAPPARISLTVHRHPSLLSIASGRSSELHPVTAQRCCMYVRAGRPVFTRSCEGVHRSTSLMSSSLVLQTCPACLFRLILIVFTMGGRWPYSCCFVDCCLQDLFNFARNILVLLLSFFLHTF